MKNEQLNLIGYSYGSLVAADIATFYSKQNIKIDNLVLMGSPIASSYLQRLQNDQNIKNVIIVNLTEFGDPLYAGMNSGMMVYHSFKTVLPQMGTGTGHFYYEPNNQIGDQRRLQLAEYLYKQGLR